MVSVFKIQKFKNEVEIYDEDEGDFTVIISLNPLTYNDINYYVNNNDIYALLSLEYIKKKDLIFNYLDNRKISVKLNKLKFNNCNNLFVNYKSYKISNNGLFYYDKKIKRGNLYVVLFL